MQRHIILLNQSFSSTTMDTSSSLTISDGYQVNNVQGLGGGVVNPSNVRFFLNDDVNDYIINDFFSYLTGSTNTEEFSEIFHSDQKLSDVFNNYYTSSVLNNQTPSTSVIDESLAGTYQTSMIRNTFNYDGYSPSNGMDGITLSVNESTRQQYQYNTLGTFTEEESYYVPVFINRTTRQSPKLNFQSCEDNSSLIINNGEFTFKNSSDLFGAATSDNFSDPLSILNSKSSIEPVVEINKIELGQFIIISKKR